MDFLLNFWWYLLLIVEIWIGASVTHSYEMDNFVRNENIKIKRNYRKISYIYWAIWALILLLSLNLWGWISLIIFALVSMIVGYGIATTMRGPGIRGIMWQSRLEEKITEFKNPD